MGKNQIVLDRKRYDQLYESLGELRQLFPEETKNLVEVLAKTMKETVDSEIANASPKINNPSVVQDWQEYAIGSGGHYAAVRARAKTYYKDTKRKSYKEQLVAKLTQVLEGGARTRLPSGKNIHYVPRITYGRIRARKFYTAAAKILNRSLDERVRAFGDELLDRAWGGTWVEDTTTSLRDWR